MRILFTQGAPGWWERKIIYKVAYVLRLKTYIVKRKAASNEKPLSDLFDVLGCLGPLDYDVGPSLKIVDFRDRYIFFE